MSSNKKLVRSTKKQITFLCQYMTAHPEFAAGDYRSPLGARHIEQEWANLKLALDEVGPQRTVEQWKICWRDQKRKAQVEDGARGRAVRATGNSTEVPVLTDNTVLVRSAIGTDMAVGIGPDESPIGYTIEATAPTPVVPAPSPVLLAPEVHEATPSPSSARPARAVKRRVRRTLPPERFLNAQLELNRLIKELIVEVREGNELRREQLDLLHRRGM